MPIDFEVFKRIMKETAVVHISVTVKEEDLAFPPDPDWVKAWLEQEFGGRILKLAMKDYPDYEFRVSGLYPFDMPL